MKKQLLENIMKKIANEYQTNPDSTYRKLAKKYKCCHKTILFILDSEGVSKKLRKERLKIGAKKRRKFTEETEKRILKEYLENGITFGKIAIKYGCGLRSITGILDRQKVSRNMRKHRALTHRTKEISPKAKELTLQKAYVLGVVGPGDGWVQRTRMGLKVIDKDFADAFAECLESVYGLKCSRYIEPPSGLGNKNRYCVVLHSKMASEDILSYGVSFKEKTCRVPNKIKKSSPEIQGRYLKGVFDSQGTNTTRAVNLILHNPECLKKLGEMLSNLGINWSIYEKRGRLCIYGRKSLVVFKERIGFTIKRKRDKLEKLLNSYKLWLSSKREVDSLVPKMKKMRENGMSYEKIANKLGISTMCVWKRLNSARSPKL